MRRAWILPSLLFTACPNPPPPPAAQPVTISFSAPRGGVIPPEFRLPYPNELWRRNDGTLNLSSFRGVPNLLGAGALAEAEGEFGNNSGIYLHFEGQVDLSSLPTPEETLAPQSPIFVAELLPNGTLGERRPLLIDSRERGSNLRPERTIALMPIFGLGFRPSSTYVAVITSAIKGADGTPASPDTDFAAIRAEGAPQDPELAAADALYEPAFSALTQAGLTREEIVWATVFRAGDPVAATLAIGDFVFAGGNGVPAPVLSQPFAPAGDPGNILVFRGQYETPRLQEGTPPFSQPPDGQILFDANGDPIVQAIDPVDVVVTIPDQNPPNGGWPIVIYNHGTGGAADSFVDNGDPTGVASQLAAQGFAVVGIDQPFHGARAIPGFDVNLVTFNPFNIGSTRENVRQALADNVQLLRILEAGVVLDRNGQQVPLDASNLFFMGHSQGALSGPPLLAWADQFGKFKAAVLSGPSGSISLAITDRIIPLPNGTDEEARALVATLFGEDVEDVDEFHPTLNLVQQIIERNDPLNYGPFLVKEAQNPIDILLTQGFLDVDTPPRTIDAISSAIGLAPALRQDGRGRAIEGLFLQGFEGLNPPFSANTTQGVTAALGQFPDDNHFAIFFNEDAQALYSHFLGTALSVGRAEVQPYGAQ